MPNPIKNEVAELLARIFAAESRAAIRNRAFAAKAVKEEKPGPAALFVALAMSQETRARRILNLMRGKIGNTEENLKEAFGKPAGELYPDSVSDFAAQSSQVIQRALEQSGKIEEASTALYRQLLAQPESRPDYLVCRICGHLALSQAPERCPVCKAIKEKFQLAR